jgi:hypothetical protein
MIGLVCDLHAKRQTAADLENQDLAGIDAADEFK